MRKSEDAEFSAEPRFAGAISKAFAPEDLLLLLLNISTAGNVNSLDYMKPSAILRLRMPFAQRSHATGGRSQWRDSPAKMGRAAAR
jgi:hypothetical protein